MLRIPLQRRLMSALPFDKSRENKFVHGLPHAAAGAQRRRMRSGLSLRRFFGRANGKKTPASHRVTITPTARERHERRFRRKILALRIVCWDNGATLMADIPPTSPVSPASPIHLEPATIISLSKLRSTARPRKSSLSRARLRLLEPSANRRQGQQLRLTPSLAHSFWCSPNCRRRSRINCFSSS